MPNKGTEIEAVIQSFVENQEIVWGLLPLDEASTSLQDRLRAIMLAEDFTSINLLEMLENIEMPDDDKVRASNPLGKHLSNQIP